MLDPSAPDRIRAALQVRVNGTPWDEVPSFFGAKPIDEVYILRADPDGTPRITFGDGVRGARPASGVGNVDRDVSLWRRPPQNRPPARSRRSRGL